MAEITYNRNMNNQPADRQVFMRKMPTLNYILVGVVCALMVPFAILSICKVAEVGTLYSADPNLDIAAATIEIALAAMLLMFTLLSRYIVTPTHMVYQRVFCTKIPIERLLMLRYEASEKMLVLYYADEAAPEGVRLMVLQVFPDKTEAIVAAIQRANPHVSYEFFDKNRQVKDE